MNRREFLGLVAAGLIASPSFAENTTPIIPKRTFGRTGWKVPIVGFGGGSRFLMFQNQEKAVAALERAIALGITYIDTAHSYGNGRSEEWIGTLMPNRRKEVVLATKIPGRTAEDAKRQIDLSLKRLRTDYLDVLHIHSLQDMNDLATVEARGGVLEALYAAREQKIARAIGITCHASPVALQAALERHDFDCTQMALNAARVSISESMKPIKAGEQSFEQLALPAAVRKKMGVIAMKVFGQEHLLGSASIEDLLTYALSLPVSLASLGMPEVHHIEQNASLAAGFSKMSGAQRRRLNQTIALEPKTAMTEFFQTHQDV